MAKMLTDKQLLLVLTFMHLKTQFYLQKSFCFVCFPGCFSGEDGERLTKTLTDKKLLLALFRSNTHCFSFDASSRLLPEKMLNDKQPCCSHFLKDFCKIPVHSHSHFSSQKDKDFLEAEKRRRDSQESKH